MTARRETRYIMYDCMQWSAPVFLCTLLESSLGVPVSCTGIDVKRKTLSRGRERCTGKEASSKTMGSRVRTIDSAAWFCGSVKKEVVLCHWHVTAEECSLDWVPVCEVYLSLRSWLVCHTLAIWADAETVLKPPSIQRPKRQLFE